MHSIRRAPALALVILGVVGCAGDSATGLAESAVVITRVEILPKTGVTLPAAAMQRFTGRAYWSDGQDREASLLFEATDGSIDSTGSLKAPRRGGQMKVIVKTRDNKLADTANVTVLPPALNSLSVSPSDTTIASSSSLQLRVSAIWSDGSDSLPNLVWSAPSGGSVGAQGLFTAPTLAGTYLVVAAHADGTLRDTAFVTVAAPTLTRLTVDPQTLIMAAGTQHQFTASAEWSDGSTTLPALSWSRLGGGTISTTGRYTAPSTAGTYFVVVRHAAGTLRDTAVVTVTAPPVTLTAFRLSPDTVRVRTGGSVQLSTTATWSDGATRPVTVSYAATGGSVTNGLFSAGSLVGTFMVIATCSCGGADSSSVIVEPPPPLGAFTPNLPSGVGLQLVTDTRFGNLLPGEQMNADGLAYAWDGRNNTHAGAPYGDNVFETFYAGGSTGDGDGGSILFGPENQGWRRFYFSMAVYLPANYVMHNTGGEKFFYPLVNTNGSITSLTMFNWHLMGSETATSPTWSLYLDPQIGGPRIYQNHNARPTKGSYQIIEIYAVMNTPGQSNGVWRAWVNGQLAADYSNVRYSNAASQSTFDGIRFTGTRGGPNGTVPVPAGGQVRRYNRLAFYGSTN